MRVPEADSVIIPDIHGHTNHLEDVYEKYGESVRYIFLGDIVDGPDVKHTLDIVNFMVTELGAVAIKGNHEWVLDATLNASDDEERHKFRHVLWRRQSQGSFKGYERGMLASYDIDEHTPTNKAAAILRNRMQTAGHLALLREMPLFVEAPDFIAVHAGLVTKPWLEQRDYLEAEEKQLLTDEPKFSEEPDQLFGLWVHDNGRTSRDHTLARSSEVKTEIGDRALVTGHAHMTLSADKRITDGGQRVRLASRLEKDQPMFVYQTWDRQVVEV